MQEIERKFLVLSDLYKKEAYAYHMVIQGYLNTDPQRSVRIRIIEDRGFLTIKGPSSDDGTTRLEWEKEIDPNEAMLLLELCEQTIIKKTRYLIVVGSHTYEVDEFHNANQGLVLAEIELQHKNEDFEKPSWLGKEVTGDERYYNASLSMHPYRSWGIDN